MIFRQLFEPETCTYTYLLGCSRTGKAVLIDPVDSEVEAYLAPAPRAIELLRGVLSDGAFLGRAQGAAEAMGWQILFDNPQLALVSYANADGASDAGVEGIAADSAGLGALLLEEVLEEHPERAARHAKAPAIRPRRRLTDRGGWLARMTGTIPAAPTSRR